MLAACEESTSLSRALSSLTDVTENVSAVYGKQAEVDNSKFSESIYEYIMLISALKDVFGERVRAWQQWQDAQQTLARKRDQKTKIDLSAGGRNERSDQLKGEIEDTVQKMDQLEQHFIELSKAIREEVARFDADRKQDMKKMLVEYMESMIHTHTEVRFQQALCGLKILRNLYSNPENHQKMFLKFSILKLSKTFFKQKSAEF